MSSLLALAVLGCSDGVGPRLDEVEIRIGNESASTFNSVSVMFPEEQVDYGTVSAGGFSEYRPVTTAYRFARVDVLVGDREIRIQPFDYLGESPLTPGRYTYRLYFHDEYLQLELKRDN